MREGFEDRLRTYAKVIRDEHDRGGVVDRDFLYDADISDLVDEYVQRERVTHQSQEEIIRLQEKKAAIMEKLHASLAALDDPTHEDRVPAETHVVRLTADGVLASECNGDIVEVTTGDILTDHEWGVTYHLDETVPRTLRKRYLVECAKGELRALLDEQIRIDEEARVHRRRNPYRQGNFFRDLKDRDIEQHAGLVAEKMVRIYLKKLAIDHDMPYEIIEADLYQDTIEKIDFIVRHRVRQRGVGVDAAPEVTGVQFTIRTNERARQDKQAALDAAALRRREVDDVVLVQAPLHDVIRDFQNWQADPRPGGPTSLWDDTKKRTLVARVLEGVLSDEEFRDALASLQN